MIGCMCISVFPYYDIKRHANGFKKRPVLVIGQADSSDYVCLPISRVTRSEHIDAVYDVTVSPNDVPFANLKQTSYIRTHKQTVVNNAALVKTVVDFKAEYAGIFQQVISKVELFQTTMLKQAKNELIKPN